MRNQFEIAVGQTLRFVTHIRHFYKSVRYPNAAQSKKLLEIVRANQNTAFGTTHHFSQINSIADFQSYVPACEYEDLAPYVKAVRNGKKCQLTTEEPVMFATTSGTTSEPKFIPITKSY